MSSPALATALRSTTVACDPGALDLVAMAGDDGMLVERDGCGLAARGVALRVEVGAAEAVLRSIAAHDEIGLPGCGPVAIGALPFDPRSAATLVVPRIVWGRAPDGTAWTTTIGPIPDGLSGVRAADDGDRPDGPPRSVSPPPQAYTVAATAPHEAWRGKVRRAIDDIDRGRLRKVVVARDVLVEADRPILPSHLLPRLRALHPSSTLFSLDGFVGASPELLVSRRGAEIRSHALGGTAGQRGDVESNRRLAAELMGSGKERVEHAMVVEAIAAALAPLCRSLQVPDIPSVVPLGSVVHLATVVAGTLAEAGPSAPRPSALALARLLHPTPAVAGVPTDEALHWLREHEGLDRGRYAGPVGWVDARGDGDWAVGIRCAELDGHRARLFAGAGVVAGSDPEAELAETQLKLETLLAVLVRP